MAVTLVSYTAVHLLFVDAREQLRQAAENILCVAVLLLHLQIWGQDLAY